MNKVSEWANRVRDSVKSTFFGKEDVIDKVLVALLCRGHVLIEDVPGVGKTVLGRAMALSIGGEFNQIQCTPDLLPADVLGVSVFNPKTGSFDFRRGPVMTNVLLVDEINRATPRTQSALLEAMAEGQVTVDGVTRRLPDPFLLIATENPIEFEGTFPLPEAQLDRFAVRGSLGYPGEDEELLVIREQRRRHPLDTLEAVVTADDVARLRRAAEDVYVDELLERWIVRLVRATRSLPAVEAGASVRGSLALVRTARAWALLHGRDCVLPEDVERLFVPVLGHRLMLRTTFLAETRNLSRDEALALMRDQCLELAPPPRPDWAQTG